MFSRRFPLFFRFPLLFTRSHSPLVRLLSCLLAICYSWSFILAGGAVAAQSSSHSKTVKVHALRGSKLANTPYSAPRQSPLLPSPQSAGVPQAKVLTSTRPLLSSSPTLLDEVGHLAHAVSPAQAAAWKTEIKTTHPAASRAALLHLWLGEYALAQEEQPEQAQWHFGQTQKLTKKSDPLYGLAAYDSAITLYYEGAYEYAAEDFSHLLALRTALPGYDRRICALWWRHASACAGYHAQHSLIGIPEPPKLDPFCGAAAVAACLRALGRPYDRRTVASASHVTGEGNTLADIVAAGPKLGVSIHSLAADEEGLKLLPKPLVAHVERDHFVAVVKADKTGVSYLCSDCGMWPGGRVDLTWAQWRTMNPGVYAVVTLPGSPWDKAVTVALSRRPAPVQLAARLVTGTHFLLHLPLANLLQGHIFATDQTSYYTCDGKATSLTCADCLICCFTDIFGPVSDFGAIAHDPVNLATGEEEYKPAPDITVYNPTGLSVAWSRVYESLNSPGGSRFPAVDFGSGWSQSYNVGVSANPSIPLYARTMYVVFPNGGRVAFTASVSPTASNPRVSCAVQPGAPFLVEWDYDASSANGYFTITFTDRTKWVTRSVYTSGPVSNFCFQIAQIIDRNGNGLSFTYDSHYLLTSIADLSSGHTLLTIQHNYAPPNDWGSVTSVSDCYGRSVYYHDVSQAGAGNTHYPMIDGVSQIVPTGTANAVTLYNRYSLGYQLVPNPEGYSTAFLHTITVPSPTGTGTSTATINYDPNTELVSSIVDANGNTRAYTSVNASGNPSYPSNYTKVTVTNPQSQVVYSYTAGFDNNMSGTSVTDGKGTVTESKVFSDPNDPYRPSSVTDGNSNQWNYTWDTYGNQLTETSPRSVTTTNLFSYTNFALGELTSTQEGTKTATSYAYFEPSGLTQSVSTPIPGTVGGGTVTTSYTYDALGNVLTETAPGNNAVSSITTTFNYTTDGGYSQNAAIDQPLTVTDNLGKVTHYRYDAQSNITSATDALGNAYAASYNIANQPLTLTLPATGQTGTGNGQATSTYLYPGGPLTASTAYNESGSQVAQVLHSYGPEGEMLSMTGSTEPVSYTYDALYRLSSLTDGNGHATRYYWKQRGYLDAVTYPDYSGPAPVYNASTDSYSNITGADSLRFPSYDNDGNALQRIDGRAITTNFSYADAESRLTDIQYPASPGINVHFHYDAYGRQDSMSDSTGSTSYSYDDRNVLLNKQIAYTGLPTQTISYTSYPDGSREGMSTPAGTFSYQYDGDGRPQSLTNPFSETSSWTYLDNWWLKTQTLGNGVVTTSTRDAWGELTDLVNKTSGGATLSDYGDILHNGMGDRTAVTATIPGAPAAYSGTTTYSYDAISGIGTRRQLVQEQSQRNGGYTSAFAYDGGSYTAGTGAGNPTTFKGASASYNADNQNSAFGYDGNGNPTSYQGQTLTFDAANRLSSYGSALTAGYDGLGRRAWKQTSSGRTYFLYDGRLPVCELNSSGTVTATNTFAGIRLLSRHTGSGSIFYTFDVRGNVAQKLDSSGNVLSTSMYDAFGVGTSTSAPADPWGYGGQFGYYTDNETGLALLTYRYYDPGLGRFLRRDPLRYRGGVNLYAYTRNNPVERYDPFGLLDCTDEGASGAEGENCTSSPGGTTESGGVDSGPENPGSGAGTPVGFTPEPTGGGGGGSGMGAGGAPGGGGVLGPGNSDSFPGVNGPGQAKHDPTSGSFVPGKTPFDPAGLPPGTTVGDALKDAWPGRIPGDPNRGQSFGYPGYPVNANGDHCIEMRSGKNGVHGWPSPGPRS